MAIRINASLTAHRLRRAAEQVFEAAGPKIRAINREWDPRRGTPVFTVRGRYTSRGWTEWTQGFQFGAALLQYEATGEVAFLELGRRGTVTSMATHVSHVGVHDHGFNNVSTYGTLLRFMHEGLIPWHDWERHFLELALKVSAAVQAARWTPLPRGEGYIYSFNGPHSLFIDTLRSLRSLALGHRLGHVLMGERDRRISLLGRLLVHAITTARYAVYYGEGRDAYDVAGRTAHESVFNLNDGSYRCPNSQQGYSPFSTWTRGLAWAILGYAEQLEFLATVGDPEIAAALESTGLDLKPAAVRQALLRAARVTADHYLELACTDGVPVWDTGAPGLARLGGYADRASDPFNRWEPVDSSAAAIAAQGLLRLGHLLKDTSARAAGRRYRQAGYTIARTLFDAPYLSRSARHHGLLLHSVYHRPNGWDAIARGQRVPNGESSMWGDYHALELAGFILREARDRLPPAFHAVHSPDRSQASA